MLTSNMHILINQSIVLNVVTTSIYITDLSEFGKLLFPSIHKKNIEDRQTSPAERGPTPHILPSLISHLYQTPTIKLYR
jgi:hypothetical protein